MSHRASLLGRGYQDNHLDSPRVRFRRALLLCFMTVLVPGSAHIAVGKRAVGWFAVTLWLGALGGGGYVLWKYRTDRAEVLGWFTDTDVLMLARAGIVAVAVLWGILFLDAWRLASPFRLNFMRAALITVLNLAIIGGVAGSTAYASQLIKVSRDTVKVVFKATKTSEPLKGRYNILLLGSDARADRTGIRPDSMTVASIDADTGKVVLVSLPRNLQNVPFSKGSPMLKVYPYGYNCGPTCLLNAVHTAAQNRTDLYPDSKDPGLDATIDAIQGVTDLKINYYVMVNLNGFKGLVNAVGGVTMDVKTRIAMFGHDDAYKNDLHRDRQAEAQRPAGALVRPQPRAVRRLHPHGPAEVPDGRDGRPAQPADGVAQRDQDREVRQGAAQHQHPGQGARSVRRPGAQVARREDPHGVGRPAGVQHRHAGLSGRSRRRSRRRSTSRRSTVKPTKKPKDDSGRAANQTDDLNAVC